MTIKEHLALDGHSQQEIADALGMARGSISMIENRALRKLRKLLEEEGRTFEDFMDMLKAAR